MEFFNCKKKVKRKELCSAGEILALEPSRVQAGDLTQFSVRSLDGVSSLDLFKIINALPLYVGLVEERSNHVAGLAGEERTGLSGFGLSAIKTLENFNIPIDIGRLNKKSLRAVMEKITKRCIITDAVFSSVCDMAALEPSVEAELVRRKTFFVVNVDEYSISGLAESVALFVRQYGSDSIGLSSSKRNNKRVERFLNQLLAQGLEKSQVEKIAGENAREFFLFSAQFGNSKGKSSQIFIDNSRGVW